MHTLLWVIFLLPVKCIHPFTQAGMFGYVRKHDIHTGVDIYCEEGSDIRSMTDGVVIEVIPFTGESVGSPWWNETDALAIKDIHGTVYVYGEVDSLVKVGDIVKDGQVIAKAKQVLKEDKGVNPPCMLHLEVWQTDYQSNYTWKHSDPVPKGLINPLSLFPFWVIKTPSGYKIEMNDGTYWKYFASAVDCKAYCMWRTDEHRERFIYVKTESHKNDYLAATGKIIFDKPG